MKIGDSPPAPAQRLGHRYYEKRASSRAPAIGGQRRYPSDALHRVLLCRLATDMGFTSPKSSYSQRPPRQRSRRPPLEKTRHPQASPKSINPSTVLSTQSLLKGLSPLPLPLSPICVIASALSPKLAALKHPGIKHR